MQNFIIYRKNLVYMALYIKKSITERSEVTMTYQEFQNYVAGVKAAIEKEQRIAKNFTFEIRDKGEADYSEYETADANIKDAFKKCIYVFDQGSATYKTSSSLTSLSLKSNLVLPPNLNNCYFPENYQQILNIETSEPESK